MAHVGEKRNAHGAFAVKLEGKRPLRRHGLKWGVILKRTLKIEWERVEWNNLAQDMGRWWAFVNKVVKLGVP
jgi:hypothetical protein